jgi:membrane AbrB-like protein
MERIALTLLVAFVGGYVGLKLKLPAGALLGAMIAVSVANLAAGFAGEIPREFRTIAQIVVGGMLGLSITRDTVTGLRSMALPVVVLVVFMIGVSLVAGLMISRLTGWDKATAFFASSPGGMTEMILTSMSYGADTATVALLQLVRMLAIVSFMPLILRFVLKK